jgi:hypothetical protein
VGARARTSFQSDGTSVGGWRGRDNGGGYSDGAYSVSVAPQARANARANPRAEWSVTNGRFPQTGAATTSGLDALFAD